ncbi:hypothetical protein [Streptomyces sp. NPDC003635]
MATSTPLHRTRLAVALAACLALTGCGELRSPGAAATPTPSPSGASPYVEPGAGDGAPHYSENNAHRQPREMSAAHEKDARREAARIEPVLEKLWKQGRWDPESVRAALLRLGYEERRVTRSGELIGGSLEVQEMRSRYENGEYVTPEGAMIGLWVHPDACVTAFVQESNFGASANGPYLETGCFTPPVGH